MFLYLVCVYANRWDPKVLTSYCFDLFVEELLLRTNSLLKWLVISRISFFTRFKRVFKELQTSLQQTEVKCRATIRVFEQSDPI